MDLTNEKSKIYLFGKIVLGLGFVILSIITFMNNNSDSRLLAIINDIRLIFISLFMFLLGTQEVVAKQNKIGYLNYLVGGLMLSLVITRI